MNSPHPAPAGGAGDAGLVDTLADAIVARHARLALPLADAPAVPPTADTPVYRAVRAAARRLGFIDADAECIARAWQAQSDRQGRFDADRWPTTPADFGLAALPAARADADDAFAPCPERLGLYAVLPDAAWVARMAAAGMPTLQLRFKSSDAQAVRQQVQEAVAAVRGRATRLFINDHWREAIEAGAYGVHLGQEDLEVTDLDAIRRAGLRLGLSSHGYAEMLRAAAVQPSYLALGAVYATTLKRMPTPPQGPARLAAYAALMRGRSLVAIGGIDAARFAEVKPSGVGSIAVVRALVAAADPEAEARRLMALLED